MRVEKFHVAGQSAAITGAAKQRFRLRRSQVGSDFASRGEVEILPQAQPPRLPFPCSSVADERQTTVSASNKSRRNLLRRRELSCNAYWHHTVYDLFDSQALVKRVQDKLLSNVHSNWFANIPAPATAETSSDEPALQVAQYLATPSGQQDPSLFAYWVAGNLPLTTAQRLELLKLDSVVRLLQRELELLETLEEDVSCAHCGSFLASTREIFSMSVQGAGGTFVNPGGYVYQIMTLRSVDRERVAIDERRFTQDSWFPGYSWSITSCRTCPNHLGWRFDHVDESLEPATFFGFRRAALVLSRSARRSPVEEATSTSVLVPPDLAGSPRDEETGSDSESVQSYWSLPSNASTGSDELPLW